MKLGLIILFNAAGDSAEVFEPVGKLSDRLARFKELRAAGVAPLPGFSRMVVLDVKEGRPEGSHRFKAIAGAVSEVAGRAAVVAAAAGFPGIAGIASGVAELAEGAENLPGLGRKRVSGRDRNPGDGQK
jgi:hypothetical protein